MITRLEADNYRCFRELRVDLNAYQVVIGINGVGKSTMMDLPVLLGELINDDTAAVFGRRALGLAELIHFGRGNSFHLAIEAMIPDDLRSQLDGYVRPKDLTHITRVRWELLFMLNDAHVLQVDTERLWIIGHDEDVAEPGPGSGPTEKSPQGWFLAAERFDAAGASIGFEDQTEPEPLLKRGKKGRRTQEEDSLGERRRIGQVGNTAERRRSIPIPPTRVALGRLPHVGAMAVIVEWLSKYLRSQALVYDPRPDALRQPLVSGTAELRADGTSFPWYLLHDQQQLGSVARFVPDPETSPSEAPPLIEHDALQEWIRHLRCILPTIETVEAKLEQSTHRAFIEVVWRNATGERVHVPSPGLSDGTWRILTLTHLAYQQRTLPHLLAIEEPERALHPLAITCVLDSLRSLYHSQVLIATHAPVVLAATEVEDVIVLRRQPDGGVVAQRGRQHPVLEAWKREVPLSVLMASSVLS